MEPLSPLPALPRAATLAHSAPEVFAPMADALLWRQIEAGVQQCMRLLEYTMADVYGPQTLLRSGLLPAALVQGHPGYLHALQGVEPVGGRRLYVAALDLVRGPEGSWALRALHTQSPSGLVASRWSDAHAAIGLQQVAKAYQSLLRGISARAPGGGQAHIALLTPGPYNESYAEHAYLARYLGLSLAQGSDLLVRDEMLYLQTLQGLQRVHALIKWVDDAWLDPLELRADSTLGVPGLVQVLRRGHVLLANAPGSGFLESSALLALLPALARQVFGQALQLATLPEGWSGDGSGGPVVGGSFETPSVQWRVFALADEAGAWTVLPAVPADAPAAMGAPGAAGTAAARTPIVTSRAAENLFWLGRYTERTENTVRLSRVALDALGGEDQSCQPPLAWLSALALQHGLVAPGVPPAQQAHRVFERSLVAGVWDTRHCTGVAFNMQALVLAASRVRERMSPEHWGWVMQAQESLRLPQAETLHDPVQAQRVLVHISGLLAALTGAQTERMARDDGWRLLSIGRYIERLDFLAGALAQALHTGSLSAQAGFDAVLALFDSTIRFDAQDPPRRTLDALLALVLSDPDNPRSLACVLHALRACLCDMGDLAQGRTAELAARLPQLPHPPDPTPWLGAQDAPQLSALLQECRMAARATSDALNSLFFAHRGDASQSVGA